MPLQDDQTLGVAVSTIASMNAGKTSDDLDDAMREVVRAVVGSNQKGKVTLSLTIEPSGSGVGETPLYTVDADIKVVAPKKRRQKQSFFADENCNLTRREPGQTEMRMGKSGSLAALTLPIDGITVS